MLTTLVLSGLLLLVSADNSVHILSTKYGHGQLVTSSILNWIPESHYSASKDFVIGGFEIVDSAGDGSEGMRRPIFVCRALHNGLYVAGGQKEGDRRCMVSLTGSVRTYERYQLLENVESAARVSWNEWSKYYQPSVGAVATSEKLYVARRKVDGPRPSQTHYVGTLNLQDTLGTVTFVKEDETEGSADAGELLVETEPISYELNAVKLNQAKRQVPKRSPRKLAEATIRNTGSAPAKLAEAMDYTYLHTIYWGQGHAMLKGLNTTVTMQNKTRLPDMSWGIEVRQNRTVVHTVEVHLEPGTAVNVSLRGDYAYVEVPYSGKLFSHYEDRASYNPRTISGLRREETVIDVVADLGPVYYLGNFSLVPTSPAPPSSEPASRPTTTAAATTTTTGRPTTTAGTTPSSNAAREEQQQLEVDASGEVDVDENSISVKRPEMQADNGGPLSLKDKAHSAAAPLLLRPMLLGLLLLVARVT